MSKSLKPTDGCEILPLDCWQFVFNQLKNHDLRTVSLVCKDFLTNSNHAKENLTVIHPDISILSQHLKRFPQLRRIDLTKFPGESDLDEAIREIASSAPTLFALYISPNAAFKTRSLMELGSNGGMKNLKVLFCNQAERLQDNDFVVIANSFPNLERLHIGDGNSIGLLLRNMPNLESLCIQNIETGSAQSSTVTIENSISHTKALNLKFIAMDISDNLLMEIGKAKLGLKKLRLISCRNFTVSGLSMVVSRYLKKLRIVKSNITDAGMELLLKGDVSNLTFVKIGKSQVTNSTLFLLLAKCSLLEKIKLVEAAAATNEEVNNIPLCKNLKLQKVCLIANDISDDSLERLGLICPNLKVLELKFSFNFTSKGIEAIFKSCKFITGLNLRQNLMFKIIKFNSELSELNLEVLNLSYSPIDDEWLTGIGLKCPRLLDLDLSHCHNVTIEGTKQILPNIKKLRRLNLLGCGNVNSGMLLDWMLSTGSLASLKEITLPGTTDPTEEQRNKFLNFNCLLR